jgi:hypothetical protein
MAAGISGAALCQKIGKSRSWLISAERGYLEPSEAEIQLVSAAIDEILRTREQLTKFAVESGLSLQGVRL